MKPLNLDNRPCSPISSNCVIWQGPDIACINLCAGDSVSDVVYKLATELCTIMDQLKVSNYDLTCLGINTCPPADFQDLIQLLINKICEANGIVVETPKVSGCPDCVVSVAPCFVEGTQTTMQLVDYVQIIANRICSILDQLDIINNQITNLDDRVTVLENTPPPTFTLPSIDTGCLGLYMGGLTSAPIDQVLDTLVNDTTIGYCSLINATGLGSEILAVLEPLCTLSTAITTDPNWIASPQTLADAVNNIWVALCNQVSVTVAVDNTSSVEMFITAGPDYTITAKVIDTGWIDLLGFEYYNTAYTGTASFKPQCRRIGNVVHFRGYLVVPLATSAVDGTALTYSYQSSGGAVDSYFLVDHPYTASVGPGSCQVSTSGFINFNQGLSVIPTGILSAGETLDQTYGFGYRIAYRPISAGAASTMLTTLGSVAILSTGILQWGTTTNSEESILMGGVLAFNTSPINYIQSIVVEGEFVPKFSAAGSTFDSANAPGVVNTALDYQETLVYPFSANSTLAAEIGGHGLRLDGLTAFINPCTVSTIVGKTC